MNETYWTIEGRLERPAHAPPGPPLSQWVTLEGCFRIATKDEALKRLKRALKKYGCAMVRVLEVNRRSIDGRTQKGLAERLRRKWGH